MCGTGFFGCAESLPPSLLLEIWYSMRLRDQHGRSITDLRISITDRCNYKCVYCRTGNEGALYADLPMPGYLRMVRLFVSQ